MPFIRSILATLCWLLAFACVGVAYLQVRTEVQTLVEVWPDIDKLPAQNEGDESFSDRDPNIQVTPLDAFISSANATVPWLIFAAALVANASLMRMHSAVERLE